jgi:hypothetical protein
MHNGTFYEFPTNDEGHSDTRQLVDVIVSPIFSGMRTIKSTKEIFSGPTLKAILLKYCSSSSKIVMFNNLGDELIINEKQGADLIGGIWASNSYSFQGSHRSTSTPVPYTTNKYYYESYADSRYKSGVANATEKKVESKSDEKERKQRNSQNFSTAIEKLVQNIITIKDAITQKRVKSSSTYTPKDETETHRYIDQEVTIKEEITTFRRVQGTYFRKEILGKTTSKKEKTDG